MKICARKCLLWTFVILFVLLTVIGCNRGDRSRVLGADLPYPILPSAQPPQKKVVLIVVDSMMNEALLSRMEKGTLPALQFLKSQGTYIPKLVSTFPNMSVVVESSILTGVYPHEHGIPGLVWMDDKENRVVNYGSGAQAVIENGLPHFAEDALYHLNQTHLSPDVKTLHEELNERGYTTGSINSLVYRGNYVHNLDVPDIASNAFDLPNGYTVMAPRLFTFGSLANPFRESLDLPDNMLFQQMGFNDKYPIEVLKHIVRTNQLPDFTVAFLPNMDKKIHKHGPNYNKELERFDIEMRGLLSAFGTWEEALNQCVFIVMGDHGQSAIGPVKDEHLIDLDSIFSHMKIANGGVVSTEDEVAYAVNERMAFVYPLKDRMNADADSLTSWVEPLLKDERIDVIAWRSEDGYIEVARGGTDQKLRFRKNGEWTDLYNQRWEWKGDIELLDINVSKGENKRIIYGKYPDVLQQLWSIAQSHTQPTVIISAKESHQFFDEGAPSHLEGGGHGSLLGKDTYAAMIIAGTKEKPRYPRIVDIKEFVLRLF